MELLFLESTTLSVMELVGVFIPLIVPFFFLLLIARFRGFFASIFFLPFFHGLMYFVSTLEVVSSFLVNLGDLGNGILYGIEAVSIFFLTFHNLLMGLLGGLINNQTVIEVLYANWFTFVPYLVLFVLFFAIFKRRRKKKEEDYF